MKAFPPASAVITAMTIFHASSSSTLMVTAQRQQQQQPCNSNTYTELHTTSTHGFDDGGCYFCTENDNDNDSTPLEGASLSKHCQQICDADAGCVAYTIGRPATLDAQQYYYGKENRANCCLELRHYSREAFVDVSAEAMRETGVNNCQRDAICWTRFEKNMGKNKNTSPNNRFCAPKKKVANQCTKVWDAEILDEEQIRKKMKFIAGGCPYEEKKYEALLALQHAECKREIFAESIDVTIITHSKATYIHASIDPRGFSMMD